MLITVFKCCFNVKKSIQVNLKIRFAWNFKVQRVDVPDTRIIYYWLSILLIANILSFCILGRIYFTRLSLLQVPLELWLSYELESLSVLDVSMVLLALTLLYLCLYLSFFFFFFFCTISLHGNVQLFCISLIYFWCYLHLL